MRQKQKVPMVSKNKKLSPAIMEARLRLGLFIKARIIQKFPHLSLADAYARVGHLSGDISSSTIERIIGGQVGASIDTLMNLAITLEFELMNFRFMDRVVQDVLAAAEAERNKLLPLRRLVSRQRRS